MRSLNFKQKLALITIVLIGLFLFFLFWNKQIYPKASDQSYEVAPADLEGKLLIAKQSSPFKDSIVLKVVQRYRYVPVQVEVIDIGALRNIAVSDFDAILIVYRWEARNPPELAHSFIHENLEEKSKMVVLTTSWNGLEKMDAINAMTGASIVGDAVIFSGKIIKKLDLLLTPKN